MSPFRTQLLGMWLLLRCLTPRRLWNYALVIMSYGLARLTGRPIHWGQPVSVGIEPTTACNLRCPQCPSGLRAFTRPTGRLQPGVFDKLIDEVAPDALFLVMYFQGEPFLNPHFLELVHRASQRGLYTQTSTNAHFLDDETAHRTVESGLTHLIVSVDGATQDTYSRYRIEGDLAQVLTGIRNVVRWKRQLRRLTPIIDLQFIVFAHNEHEIGDIKRLGRELGVDRVSIKSAQVYDHDGPGAAFIPRHSPTRRYDQQSDGSWSIRNPLRNHCWKLWQGVELTWDGRVLPCCFDKDAEHVMGIFPASPLRAIWRGSAYRQFRAQLVQARSRIPMCTNCTEGTLVG